MGRSSAPCSGVVLITEIMVNGPDDVFVERKADREGTERRV
jgi:Flp pilus assembly CpaF family ATPase